MVRLTSPDRSILGRPQQGTRPESDVRCSFQPDLRSPLMGNLWFEHRPTRGFHPPPAPPLPSCPGGDWCSRRRHDILSFPALPLKQWRDDCFGKRRDCSSVVPRLRQRDLKRLHSWFSEETQPRANGGFYSPLCFLSASNICFNPPSCQSGFLLSVVPGVGPAAFACGAASTAA